MAKVADSDSIEQIAPPRGIGMLGLGIVSLVAGVLGWWASFRLFSDYMASLKDSGFVPSCDLSAVVSCAKNYESGYGSLFGFSNTVIGLSLFVIPVAIGVLLLARVQLPRWVYAGYSLGLLGGIALISYLQFASFTDLKTLCVYCLLIWSMTIPLFWGSLSLSLKPAPEAIGSGPLRMIRGVIVENWWLIALVHLSAVLVFGELTIGAVSGLFGLIFG